MPIPEKSNTDKIRSAGTLGVITTFSRVLGLVREIVVAAILGTSVYSDAFALAFSIPDLFRRLFSEGALVSIFIPTFTTINKKEGSEKAFAFAGSFISILACYLGLICICAIIAAPIIVKYTLAFGYSGETLNATVLLTRIMLGYVVLISLTAVYQGVLNSFSIFWVSSLTPVLLNISVIALALVLSPFLENPAIGFAVGIMVGGVIQLLFHLPFIYQLKFKIKYKFNWKDPVVKNTLSLMIPAIFGIGIYQINIVISNVLASSLQSGSISSLKFSNRLVELIIGIIVVSISIIHLPRLSVLFIDNKREEIRETLQYGLNLITFLTIPVTFGGFFLAEEIVTLLFGRGEFDQTSILMTTHAFQFHLTGLCFIAWNRLLLTGYQASGYIRPLIRTGVIVVIINLLCAGILKEYLGHRGIALATSISQLSHTLLLVFFLRNLSILKAGWLLINKSNLLSLFSGILMIIAMVALQRMLILENISLLMQVIIFIFSGAGIYFLSSYLFKNKVFKDICQAIAKH